VAEDIGDLDDEIGVAAHAQAHPDAVAEIDQLLDPGREDIGQRAGPGVDLHPFRTDRQSGALAFLRETLTGVARISWPLSSETRQSAILDVGDNAVELVVLADELRHEGVAGLLVEDVRRGDLLGLAVVEHHDAVRHGQRLAWSWVT
jgi:hypothetical protein